MTDTPQLYLMTPAGAQASALGPLLTEVMDRFPPACLRIRAGAEEDELGRLADLAREIAHNRDVAVVIEASHSCMTARGVRTPGVSMTTSRLLGCFLDDARSREEVMSLMGY